MLTDVKVRNAKPADQPYKLPDAGGLHLHVATSGRRTWRWRYQRDGRDRLIVLGEYPTMSLREAREARDDRRHGVRTGTEPQARRAPSPTLADATDRWHATNAQRWKPHHATDVLNGLQAEILDVRLEDAPTTLGKLPIAEVSAPMLITALRRLENRGAIDTAHRVRGRLASVFAFAIAEGMCETNPAEAIRRAMKPHIRRGRRPAVRDIEAARDVLRRAEAIPARPVTRLAMRLLALTAQRPGDIGGAQWPELLDLDGPEPTWRIPATRLKFIEERAADIEDHDVPLSRQAVETIAAARTLTGRTPFLFPNDRNAHAPMSSNALGLVLRRAGMQGVHVPHGWRATFSTIMNERDRSDGDVIDLMLAHLPEDDVEAAYNRALYMPRRRELAQLWADLLLDGLPPPSELIGLPRR